MFRDRTHLAVFGVQNRDAGPCSNATHRVLVPVQVLAEELPGVLRGVTFKRSMRWRGDAAFSRPLRWLLSMHGQEALRFCYAGAAAGATTRLLRNSPQPEVQVQLPIADGATPHACLSVCPSVCRGWHKPWVVGSGARSNWQCICLLLRLPCHVKQPWWVARVACDSRNTWQACWGCRRAIDARA
jgi:Glycyl-tRNA synthetase beta subunit